MARSVYDSQNFEQNKWPEVKIFIIIDLFFTKCARIISSEGFYFKNAFLRQFFYQKVKASPVCGGVFVYSGRLGIKYDSQVTNRSAAGGSGLSQGVLPSSYWSPGSHM
jgi:hypothetical protein